MKLSRSLLSLWAMFLAGALVLAACSKKDVKDDQGDEQTFEQGETSEKAEPGPTVGAGEAGVPAQDLEIIYFAFDSYALTSSSRDALKRTAQWLKDNSSASVQIEGHCDERGTTEYNLALGERRANATKEYLTRLGVDNSKLSIISYGEERPLDPGHDESAWSKNRRAAFVVLSK